MGVTTLTKRDWLLLIGAVSATSTIATFVWRFLSSSFSPIAAQASIPVPLLLPGFCALLLFVLLWLRSLHTRTTWLKLWLYISPWLISSIAVYPLSLFLLVPGIFLFSLLLGLWGYYARLYPLFGLHTSLHTARFAWKDEVSELHSHTPHPTSLLLGENLFRKFYLVRPTKTRRELGNMLIVAPTRGGKGLLATSQLLSWGHSVVVNDLKGELFAATAGYRSTLGKVFVIDPTGIGHRYDPLTSKTTEDQLYSAAARLLFQPHETDPIFTQRATGMLAQLFLAARREGQSPFPYVRQMIRLGVGGAARRLQKISPELATQFLDVSFEEANFSDRFLLSCWGTLTAKTKPLLTETVIRCFNGSDFTPAELMCAQKPITIYLRWPERDLLAISPLVRLLWGSLIDELITTYDSREGRGCKPVLMLVDEAGRTTIPSLADHATTVVGRGISLMIFIQSLEQLTAEYGHARSQVLRDNMESQMYYRPSGQETADYLEHCLGRMSGYAASHTMREGAEASEGLSEQGIPLMTAQEIKRMKDEHIIGFHRRLPPFKIRRIDWRHHRVFIKRRQLPAPELPTLPQIADIPLVQSDAVAADVYVDPDMLGSGSRKNTMYT